MLAWLKEFSLIYFTVNKGNADYWDVLNLGALNLYQNKFIKFQHILIENRHRSTISWETFQSYQHWLLRYIYSFHNWAAENESNKIKEYACVYKHSPKTNPYGKSCFYFLLLRITIVRVCVSISCALRQTVWHFGN